ncbi:MAG: thioredoxin family protein [Caldisericia bacterium]|jgi:glutaredoxin-like protein|nr:thioredoxin family protein [Caldisericia bacterium]
MGLIQEKDKRIIKERFDNELIDEVRILFFKKSGVGLWTPDETEDTECRYCKEAEEIYTDVVSLSDKLKLEIYELGKDKDIFDQYKVERIPTIVILGKNKGLVRYVGIPAGYEFTSFIEDIIDASKGDVGLKEDNKKKIEDIKDKVHIQVFVTPTCPYCPRAVRTAHKIAFLNENIVADMVEATEFPNLSDRYNVYAVPKIVINDKIEFEGAIPEDDFVDEVLRATS